VLVHIPGVIKITPTVGTVVVINPGPVGFTMGFRIFETVNCIIPAGNREGVW